MNSILQTLAFLFLAVSAAAQCPPVLLNCPITYPEVCDESANNAQFWNESYWWNTLYESHDLPEGIVNFQISVVDTCQTGNVSIKYRLHLDLDGNGSRETVIESDNLPGFNNVQFNNAQNPNFGGGTPRAFDERPVPLNQKYGFALQTTVSGDTITAGLRWHTEQAPDTYVLPELPHSTLHQIEWLVTQGNEVQVCSYLFKITDCKKPNVICINDLSVNIMPTKMIQLSDSDFLQFTDDNITQVNQLRTGIRKSGSGFGFPTNPDGSPQKSVIFDCTELGANQIELWSMDKPGNAGFCETYVIVQDNMGICESDPAAATVCVQAACNNLPMEEVSIIVNGSHPALPPLNFTQVQTGGQGCTILQGQIPFSSGYSIEPIKDNDPLNGVSTYDLILINKHILGLEPLGSPYKLIAADANSSRSVSTFDIVELRKLILGVYTELPNNRSWRFVPKNFSFPNPNNPFQSAFPEQIQFDNSTTFPVDFLGVKIGDINCNAIVNNVTAPFEDRVTTALAMPDAQLAAGQILETPLYLPAASECQGLQFALEYDPEKIELINIQPGELPGLTAENFAQPRPGMLTFSWFDTGAQNLAAGTALLQLHWRAKMPLALPEALGLQPKQLRAELYTADAQEQHLELLFGSPTEAYTTTTIFAPQPNPTSTAAVIPVQISAAQSSIIELFDLNGRLVFQSQNELPIGLHRLEIPAATMPHTGVYVWRVQLGDVVKTGKLVRN